ncbi:MAG: hypothetical protein ACYDEX_18600 [Mobilitalea sp.]
MSNDIMKIYNMLYSPIITPYNLLENAKLDNYSYVKYYKDNDGVIAEMECLITGEGIKTFYYHFDKKDFLQKVYIKSDLDKLLVFDRGKQLENSKTEYFNSKIINTAAV